MIVEEIKTRYKNLAKQYHPDSGGDNETFMRIKRVAEEAIKYLQGD